MIRLEQECDYRQVEEVTREAFWNLYMPGADEHFIVHKLRTHLDFIEELSFVAEEVQTNQIVGHIAYSLSTINDKERGVDHRVITFGPLSVLPRMQGKGVGSSLVNHSMRRAKDMGFRAVVIKGSPSYYARFGFENGKKFNICDSDGTFPKALLVKELTENALDGINGHFIESSVFLTNAAECEIFDKGFPHKEKFMTASQKMFEKMVSLKYDDPDPLDLDNMSRSTERI